MRPSIPRIALAAISLVLLTSPASAMTGAPAGLPADWIDAKDHGTVGDGVADDTAALVAALAAVPPAGGTLYVGSGNYRVTQSLDVDRGALRVVCGASAWFVVDAPGIKLLNFRGDHAPGGRAAGIAVEGCGFRDPAPLEHVAAEESHGIILHSIDGAVLRDLKFVDLGDESVDIIRSSRVALLDSHAAGGVAASTKAGAGTFGVTNSGLVQIRGNTIEGNRNGSAIRVDVSDPAVDPETVSHVSIVNNQIVGAVDEGALGDVSGTGISVRSLAPGVRGLIVTGNEIVDPLRMGIDIVSLAGGSFVAAVVNDNIVIGGGGGVTPGPGNRGAIDLEGASVAAVTGNVVLGWGAGLEGNAGVRLGGAGIAVTGNAIDAPVRHGIRSDKAGSSGNSIVGNLSLGQIGVRGRGRDLIALNKTDKTRAVRLPVVGECAVLATTLQGILTCADGPAEPQP